MKKSSIALLIIISLVILILLVLFVPKFINKAPNVPINPNPKNDETGISISPTLSWEATDPNGDELVYDIYLGKEGNLELLISNLATNNYTTRKLEFGTTYYWKVVAKDNRGAETEGPIWKFTTNYLPEVPSNPQPENGATNVSTRPILKWKAIDRDGDKLIYDVYFGTNPNFKIPIVSNFETAEFKPENLEFKTTYYWKIVVKDGKGGETEGPIWKFTTIKQNDPPLTPYEPFPFDGTTGQPININLSWKSGDPDKDELSYDLYFGIVGQLQKIASDLKESSYKIENLNYGTMYNWKVIAKDGKGGISESPVWQFTTNYLPEIDKEIEPEDGASGVLINPMLKWSATDRDGDKLTYDLYLGKGEELELVAKDLEENSYMVEGLENGETYSWKIVVKDERGGEVEGPVWKFTTNYLPEVPSNPSPEDGANGILKKVELRWSSSDKDGDELRYDLYFGKGKELELVASDLSKNTYEIDKLEFETTYYWKVVVKDKNNKGVEGPVWKFTTNYLPEIGKEIEPKDGASGVSINPMLKWSATDRDGDKLTYDLYLGKGEELELVASDLEENSYMVEGLENGETYSWKIVVKDERGGEVEGPVWKFTTNYLPEVPSNPSPEDGANGILKKVELRWSSSDKDGDELRYDLYFGKGKELELVASDLSKNTYEIDKLEFETTYYWKVVVKDKNNKGVEGPVWQFTTNYLPKIDGEIEPEDGASGVLINPTLKWSATDRDGDKLTYDLYLGKGEELELVAKDLEENSYMVEGLENGETYSWKIVVKDERGGEVEGPVWKFTTNYLPEVPNEPYPIDESTNVSLLPTLSWKSFDKDGDEISYDIYFGNENPPKLYKEDYNYDRIEVEKLEVNTTYYWKIVAKDERGGKVEGPVWSFSTTRPPEIPKEPIPEDNATGIRTKITLSWKASDPDNDILLYDLYFGTKDNLELKIENYESNKFTVPEKLKEGTTYYWKVVVKDDKGGITDGPIWNFTTNYPPNKPYNPSPKDGETGVSINPTLKWEASDPDGDKLIYDIYFGTEDNFKLIKSDYNSTTFNPGQLKENTTYYWKIVAKDEKNGRTESPFWSFTTLEKNSLPNKPTNPYPSNKEVDVSNHPILKWEATDPDGDILMYDVYFGTNENPPLVLKDSKNNYFDPGELSFNTTYYWKIVVRDEKGESIEGPLWQFKTKNSPNWQYTYGGSSNDLGYSILKTVDGGYVVVGYTNSNDYDIKNNFGGFDFMLLKLDKNGKLEWERTYGGSGYDLAYSIDHTQDNGYIIAGYTNSNDGNILENKGEFDAWIIKLDNLGNIIWQKTFGSSGIDFAKSIKQTKDGGYIVAGWTTSNDGDIEFNNGFSDYWILKLDDKGKIVWQKVLGGSNQDIAESITEVKDGYIVVGHSNSNDGDVKENKGKDDVWIVKLDFNGNILWTKTIGGNDFDYATSVFATKDGGFIVSINTTSSDGDIPKNNGKNDILLIKFDNDGNVIWKKVFGGSNDDYVYTLKETNNGYVIVGNTNSNDGDFVNDKRKFDAFIGILDENGNLKFIKTFGGSLDDYALDLVIDDGFVIVGYSNSNDGDITENKGNNDVWIFKMQKID